LAGLIYGLAAFGWFFVLRKMELLNAGVIYILFSLIFLALFSLFYFKEKINPMEILGLALASVAILILYRFSE
jgi:drug/metabolite transporter (DMT)-like permease